MDFPPFFHETEIALSDDFTLHMVIDLPAVDRLERLLKSDISSIAKSMTSSVAAMAKVLWGVTREHHDDLDLSQIAGILLPGPEMEDVANSVVVALGHLMVKAGFLSVVEPIAEPKPKQKSAAKPRGARRNG